MSDQRTDFDSRLRSISGRHQALARGYTASLRHDGLIVVRPKRAQFRLPVRGFVLLMAIFMGFKGLVLASLGTAGYQDRLDVLRTGTQFEQAGAFVMGVDPVSKVIAGQLAPFFAENKSTD